MKQYFTSDLSPIANKYVIRSSFDLLPLHYTVGSFSIIPARILGISFPNYLRLCRDEFNGSLKGKNHSYPIVYFDSKADADRLCKFLNERTDKIFNQDTFITADYLAAHAPCDMGFDEFEKLYPNGAYLSDIIKNPKTPIHWLQWGYEHLTINEAQEELYRQAVKIINSYPTYLCYNVVDSQFIFNSHSIYRSKNVANSKLIEDSTNIYNSSEVKKSNYIKDSHSIIESNNIYTSKNISKSTYCLNSEKVRDSSNIFQSTDILSSHFIRCSEKISFSYFTLLCKNCKAVLFCTDLEGKELHLFNKPISYTTYREILLKIRELDNKVKFNLVDVPITYSTPKWSGGQYNLNLGTHYEFSAEFLEWVQSLPNFDEELFYRLTLNKNVFKEENTNG